MAIRQVQYGSTTGGSVTATFSNPTLAGSIILAIVGSPNVLSVASVSDTHNTYNGIDSATDPTTAVYGASFVALGTTPITAITATISGSSGFNSRVLIIIEYTGLSSATVDQHRIAVQNTNTPTLSTSGPTSQANELVIGYLVYAGTRNANIGAGMGNSYPPTNSSFIGTQVLYGDYTAISAGTQTVRFASSATQDYIVGIITLAMPGSGGSRAFPPVGTGDRYIRGTGIGSNLTRRP